MAADTEVSIRRTDLCAFERGWCGGFGCASQVSIRRTDLCAFEHRALYRDQLIEPSFNPSNGFVCLRTPCIICGRGATQNCFNPSNGFVCLRTISCTHHHHECCSFNPSNGFVCLRTVMVNGDGNANTAAFQSVERICVPSNISMHNPAAIKIKSFNPSNEGCAKHKIAVARRHQLHNRRRPLLTERHQLHNRRRPLLTKRHQLHNRRRPLLTERPQFPNRRRRGCLQYAVG